MSKRWTGKLMMVTVMLVLGAGMALAQAPDQEAAAPGGQDRQRGGQRGAQRGGAQRGGAMMAVFGLLGTEGAVVANAEKGIDITIVAEGEEAIKALQDKTTAAITAYTEAAAAAPAEGDAGGRRGGRGQDNLYGLVMSGDVAVTSANIENGVVISLTSEKPEVVQKLQENGKVWVERMAQGAALRERYRKARKPAPCHWRPGFRGLIWGGKVAVNAARIDEGIVVSIASDDEPTAKLVQQNMPQWIREATESRKQAEEYRKQMELRRQAQALLADPGVKVEFVNTENGLEMKISCDDPAKTKKLQELIPIYLKSLSEPAKYPATIVRRKIQIGKQDPKVEPKRINVKR